MMTMSERIAQDKITATAARAAAPEWEEDAGFAPGSAWGMSEHAVSCIYHGCTHGRAGLPDPACTNPYCVPRHIPEFVYVCPPCEQARAADARWQWDRLTSAERSVLECVAMYVAGPDDPVMPTPGMFKVAPRAYQSCQGKGLIGPDKVWPECVALTDLGDHVYYGWRQRP